MRRPLVIAGLWLLIAPVAHGEPPAAPPPNPTKQPALDPASSAAGALEAVAVSGADLSIIWGVATNSQREMALPLVKRAMDAMRGATISDSARAVVLGRAMLLDALLAPAGERLGKLVAARGAIESIEGPPTAGEASRKQTPGKTKHPRRRRNSCAAFWSYRWAMIRRGPYRAERNSRRCWACCGCRGMRGRLREWPIWRRRGLAMRAIGC
jgi:hypothetical protein